jgi:hypothetical protein
MDFSNRLKGAVTQSLVKSLLIDAGITVVPLGVEESLREVSDLPLEQYLQLNLPGPLRTLPDFFALSRERDQSWLIEVKFRAGWDEEVKRQLGEILLAQAQTWSPLYLILFFGNTPSEYPAWPSSWVRAARLEVVNGVLHVIGHERDTPWQQINWLHLSKIQDVFPRLNDADRWAAAVLEATLKVSKGLATL